MIQATYQPTGDFYSIYKIECKATGRVYIGKTIYAPYRMKKHRNDLRRGKHHVSLMQKDFDLYGEQSFSFEVIDRVERVAIPHGKRGFHYSDSLKEKEYMNRFKSYLPEYGYNYKDNYFHPLWMRKAEKRKKNAS